MYRLCLFAATLLCGLSLAACSNKDVSPNDRPRCWSYVLGDLAIGVKSEVGAAQVFALANSLNFRVDNMSGFFYVSGLPTDSLAYVKRVLLSKPYLNTRGFTSGNVSIHSADQRIHVVDKLFDMTPTNQADWLQTLQVLQLTDEARCQGCKAVMLKVPAGSERHWVSELANNPLIHWTELNCIRRM
ncbi:hypothetical protein [Hymenobacter sp. B1770]|uniref:hypothetical protein n=1 Tax=Hymenobacter sp. B1770 TaxID=1718788 RepID=UPI003CF92C69